jgi:hypothetical protein
MWGNQLNNRSPAEKMGVRGKLACATYTQTQVYLKPLLRKLKTKTLPEDISDSLTEITRYMLDRDYIQVCGASIYDLHKAGSHEKNFVIALPLLYPSTPLFVRFFVCCLTPRSLLLINIIGFGPRLICCLLWFYPGLLKSHSFLRYYVQTILIRIGCSFNSELQPEAGVAYLC